MKALWGGDFGGALPRLSKMQDASRIACSSVVFFQRVIFFFKGDDKRAITVDLPHLDAKSKGE